MKLKNYKQLFEEVDPKDWEEHDDDNYKPYVRKSIHSGYDPDEDEGDVGSDDMSHLLYLVRSLFKNMGVEVEVENRKLDIYIYAVLNKKEKISSVLKVFDIAKKLKNDILPQYESEFELYETKGGYPMLVFNFLYFGNEPF